MGFFSNLIQLTINKKEKNNFPSIVIIIEFLSIFFVAFCNFFNLLFGPTRYKKVERKYNLLVILYNKKYHYQLLGFLKININVNFDLTDF